ncbi:hypothetical protein [Tautonia plasticadhaerens]|uniref:XRE family transcriptional regulator n=1 Tax=Tautonia plasticadhaerens TaxID=2527974 RepID=A0A518HAT0_9BACT|nr:hypothetical protein [Tautonia plasticadhaerens]QDV37917.1 hypothetical protein ElP_58640 [Tautonia plasticadhaerens]
MQDRIEEALMETGFSNAKISDKLVEYAEELSLSTKGLGAESVRQWRSEGAIPNAVALYGIARLSNRPMQWFFDGVDDSASRLDEDDRFVLRVWRSMRIDADEAARRLATNPLQD